MFAVPGVGLEPLLSTSRLMSFYDVPACNCSDFDPDLGGRVTTYAASFRLVRLQLRLQLR